MNRRGFISALGATGLAGCGMQSESGGRASITAPEHGWKQFRGGPRRRGYTSRTYPADGKAVVETSIDWRSVTAPIVDEQEAIIPTPDAIVSVDLQNHTENYRIPIDHQPTLPPAHGSGVVVLVTGRGVASYSLDEQSRVWSLPAKNAFSDAASPATLGRHFVIQDGNRLRLVEQRTGTVVWKRAFDARVEGFATSTEALAVNRATGDDSKLVVLDPADGTQKWRTTIESSRLPPVVDDYIYAISEYGRLYAIADGQLQWEVETELLNPDPSR